jgi:hypothetical protein
MVFKSMWPRRAGGRNLELSASNSGLGRPTERLLPRCSVVSRTAWLAPPWSRALGLLKGWRPLLIDLASWMGSPTAFGGHLRLCRRNSTSPAKKVTRPRQMIKTVNRSIPQVCNAESQHSSPVRLPTVSPLVVDQLPWLSASFTAHLSRATTDRWCRG